MNRKKIIVCLGEVLWDRYPRLQFIGGAMANVALHCLQMGYNALIAGAVGRDTAGESLLAALRQRGMNTGYIQRVPEWPTGSVKIRLDREKRPVYTCSVDTAFDHIRPDEALDTLADKAGVVVVGTLAQRHPDSRHTIQNFLARAKKAVVVYDANFAEWNERTSLIVQETMIHADILKCNETEIHQLWKAFRQDDKSIPAFMDWLTGKYQLKRMALSLGERGCMITDGTSHAASPAVNVPVKDKTGCGDASTAALVMQYLKNASLEETVSEMNMLGAFTAMREGGSPEYTHRELAQFQKAHSERRHHPGIM